jgi:protoporphyrinogen oxidase
VGAGRFYYPRRGFGQISERYADAARAAGAELLLGWRVTCLAPPAPGGRWTVVAERGQERRSVQADHVWSTLPISLLARMMNPPAPVEVLQAAQRIDYRAMVLVYLHLDMDRFTTTDAHYFPEENVVFTRVSEPKNYAGGAEPAGRTTLCAELPCAPADEIWGLGDDELGKRVAQDLARAGLPLPRPAVGVTVKRLRQAYPIYTQGYEKPFGLLDDWADSLPNLLSYGRQGLFAHDNTHHALFMAYCAVECLDERGFDRARWESYRKVFATHVVED